MTRFLAILAALTCVASAQTFRTVTADTNNVIRTNFTMQVSQVGGALATNSTASAFPAALLRTNGDGGGLTNLPNANLTNATGVLPLLNGGTGGTNVATALAGLGILTNGNSVAIASGAFASSNGIAIGLSATSPVVIPTNAFGNPSAGIAIGRQARTSSNGGISIGFASVAFDSIAIGHNALSGNFTNAAYPIQRGVAIGKFSRAQYGGVGIGSSASANWYGSIAIGDSAQAGSGINEGFTNSIQLGTGNNTASDSIQIFSAGAITTNEWATLAALSTYPTTNISVVGTNNTNTLVFSNGILTSVTTP